MASVSKDARAMQDALVGIFNIPRTSLLRSRGGKKKQRAKRTLAAQLRARRTAHSSVYSLT